MLKITISGLKTIDEDYKGQEKAIEAGIYYALQDVGSEMKNSLMKHLKEDWYTQYTPKVYWRRSDGAPGGRAITDENNIDISVDKRSLLFNYDVEGDHITQSWYQRDGDALIEWIQKNHAGIPARPYWNNFVREQFNSEIIDVFERTYSPYYEFIKEGGSKDVDYNLSESLLDSDVTFFDIISNDDDLPF